MIFDEDIEEKIDDFPEFTDAQRQTIRQAMVGNPNAVSPDTKMICPNTFRSKTVTQFISESCNQIQPHNNSVSYPHAAMGANFGLVERRSNQFLHELVDRTG